MVFANKYLRKIFTFINNFYQLKLYYILSYFIKANADQIPKK